jgi:hypothetical protein
VAPLRDDAPAELLLCPRAAALAVTAVFVVALVVAASVAAVLVATVFGVVFETFWANAAPDHATDPNNMAATPACARARVNLIVSIFLLPEVLRCIEESFCSRHLLDAGRTKI